MGHAFLTAVVCTGVGGKADHGEDDEVGGIGQHKGSWGNSIWEVVQLGCQGSHSPVLH